MSLMEGMGFKPRARKWIAFLAIFTFVFSFMGIANPNTAYAKTEDKVLHYSSTESIPMSAANQVVTLNLSADRAKVGDKITASGTADPDTWVSIKVVDEVGNIVVFDATKSNAQGNYSLNFKIPSVPAGTLTVVAGYGTNVATGKLTVTTDVVTEVTLELSANIAEVGNVITVSGAADPDIWVSIKVVDEFGNIVFFDATRSDNEGNYSVDFKIPSVPAGTLTVVAGYGTNVATGELTVTEAEEVDKTALITAISEANTNKESVAISTNGSDVDPADKWVTQAAMTAYEEAIAVAQAVADKAEAAQQEVDEAVTALAAATTIFNEAKQDGTKEETLTTYTVTFDSKGGSEVDAITVEEGKTVTLPDEPTKEGYTFAGWFIDEEYTTEFTEETQVTGDITAYAKWEAVPVTTYTVIFSVIPEGAAVVVRDSGGTEVAAEADGTYKLEAGTYNYTVSAEGYVTKTGTITVSDKDETIMVTLEKEVVEPTTYTLTLTGEGLTSTPDAGNIVENTQVTITVTAPEAKQVATFTVGGVDKKAELVDGQYTFTIAADTEVEVTYEDIPTPVLQSIEVTTPPTKTTYIVGEELDLTGLVVTGTYSDESTAVIEITANMVSGFDSSAVAVDQVVTITVEGKTATFNVTIKETVIPVTLNLSKYTAMVGDLITASGTADPDVWVSIKVVDEVGGIVVFDATKSNAQGNYSLNFKVPDVSFGTLTVVAGYSANVDNRKLTITDEILEPPTLAAETINNTVGQAIELTFTDDAVWREAISYITVDGKFIDGKYIVSEGKITINPKVFTEAKDYEVVVITAGYQNAIVTQTMKEAPVIPTTYTLTLTGEGLTSTPDAGNIVENTKVTITVTTPEAKQVATFTVGGVDKKAELVDGQYTFTITADTEVEVTYEDIPTPVLQSIKVTIAPTKTTYIVGEDLDLTGLVVTGTYSDESTAVIEVTADMVSGFDSSAAAVDQVVTITVEGKTATFNVTIKEAEPTDAEKVATAKANLDLGDLSAVTENLTLLKTQDEATVTWVSSNIDIITNDGKVTRPAAGQPDATVTLTATITAGDASDTKEFTVTVKAMSITTYTVTFSVTPENAAVVVKDSKENVIEVEADGTYKLEAGTYNYTVSAEGYVTKTGTITVSDKDETIMVTLEKAPVETRNITSVADVADINVAYGTAKENIVLPTQVEVTLDDDNVINVDVIWACDTYDGSQAREYTFIGTLVNLPEKVTNSQNLTAAVKVIIAEAPANPPKLTADTTNNIVGREGDIVLTFDDNADWRAAITDITVDGTSITSISYSLDTGELTISSEIFPKAKNYTITVKAADYHDAIVTQMMIKPITEVTEEPIEIEEENPNLALTEETLEKVTEPINISVPEKVKEATINVKQVLTEEDMANNRIKTKPLPALKIAAKTAAGEKSIEVKIPANTVISVPREHEWDGAIKVPRMLIEEEAKKAKEKVTPDPGKTIKEVTAVVEVGAGDIPLSFNQAVRLVIPNQAGKNAGWIRGGKFTPITMILGEDDQKVANDEIPDEGDVRIDVGDDLVIWTKHFTEFVAYEQEEKAAPAKLQADITNNTIGQDIELTFVDNADWRAAITDITVDGTSISGKYRISAGKIIIASQVFNQAKDYQVMVKADGYKDAIITQTIKATETKPSRRSGGGGGGTPPDKTIGKAGGTVTDYGATVTIPANAVDKDIKVKVAKVSKVSDLPLPDKSKFIGNVVEITKDKSGDFKKAVTITLAFEKSKVDADKYDLSLCYLDEKANEWIELDNVKVDLKAGKVSGETNHFTRFAIIATEKSEVIDKEEPKPEEKDVQAVELKDIQGHWAEKSIEELVASGAVSGYPDGTFQPNKTITRAEFATILVKAFNLETKTGKVFDDTAGHWAKDNIATAQAHGMVSGYSDTTFGPNDNITREQMAVMIVKAAKLSESAAGKTFADSSQISTWAQKAVATASENQIITGYPDNTFKPKASATRAEAATVVVKALN